MEVMNDIKGSRFVLNVNGEDVYVMYAENKSEIEFYSTYTPPKLRGKGLAAIVVKAAFDYAKEKNLNVIAGCWYVRKFAEMYEEYKEMLVR